MAEKLEQIRDYVQTALADKLTAVKYEFGELTLDIPANQWLEVARFLRHDDQLACEQLIDLCGVDYLTFGDAEWDVTTASRSGFSRAVQQDQPVDLFDFGDKPAEPDVKGKRYAVVAHLISVQHNFRVRIRTWCEDNTLPVVPSLIDVWNSVNWYEREAFDLFGILFTGHPDLRRLLTDYGFVGHPFRKDFPLIGQVEMRYDAEMKRVVYEPVSIDPRVLVPHVIRDGEIEEQHN